MLSTPNLLASLSHAIQQQNLSKRTKQAYVDWVYRFVSFHGKQHPAEIGVDGVSSFLSYLANDCQKSFSTQNQAFCALLFLYKNVLHQPLPKLSFIRPQRSRELPLVLGREEVQRLLEHLSGTNYLQASLLYQSGLHVTEVSQLRVNNLDREVGLIHVWQPKTKSYRTTLLPPALKPELEMQVYRVWQLHRQDLAEGFGAAPVNSSIEILQPGAARTFGWQFLFPSNRRVVQPQTGQVVRTHAHPTMLQKSMKEAVLAAGLHPGASCLTLRHSFAVNLLEAGYSAEELKNMLGLQDVRYTRVYRRILKRKHCTQLAAA